MTKSDRGKNKEYWLWFFFSAFCFVAGFFLLFAYLNGDPHVRRGVVMSSFQNLVMAVVVWAGAISMLVLSWKDRKRAQEDIRGIGKRLKKLVGGK